MGPDYENFINSTPSPPNLHHQDENIKDEHPISSKAKELLQNSDLGKNSSHLSNLSWRIEKIQSELKSSHKIKLLDLFFLTDIHKFVQKDQIKLFKGQPPLEIAEYLKKKSISEEDLDGFAEGLLSYFGDIEEDASLIRSWNIFLTAHSPGGFDPTVERLNDQKFLKLTELALFRAIDSAVTAKPRSQESTISKKLSEILDRFDDPQFHVKINQLREKYKSNSSRLDLEKECSLLAKEMHADPKGNTREVLRHVVHYEWCLQVLTLVNAGVYRVKRSDSKLERFEEAESFHKQWQDVTSLFSLGISKDYLEYEIIKKLGIPRDIENYEIMHLNFMGEGFVIEIGDISGTMDLSIVHSLNDHHCLDYLKSIEGDPQRIIEAVEIPTLCCSLIGRGNNSLYKNRIGLLLSVDPQAIYKVFPQDSHTPMSHKNHQEFINYLSQKLVDLKKAAYLKNLYARLFLALTQDEDPLLNSELLQKLTPVSLSVKLQKIQREIGHLEENLRLSDLNEEEDPRFAADRKYLAELKLEQENLLKDFKLQRGDHLEGFLEEFQFLQKFINPKNQLLIDEIELVLTTWPGSDIGSEKSTPFFLSPTSLSSLTMDSSYSEINLIARKEEAEKRGIAPTTIEGVVLSPSQYATLKNYSENLNNSTAYEQASVLLEIVYRAQKAKIPILKL